MQKLKDFKVDDYVIIKTEDEKSGRRVGKIEKIFPDSTFRYVSFIFPEDTVGGRKEYNSINEIYKTNTTEKEYFECIISKCEVIHFNQYIQRKLKKTDHGIYFYRQVYNKSEGEARPELDPMCYCHKLFNPDIEYDICKKCGDYFHIECYLKSGMKKCCNDTCQNIISNQLNQNQLKFVKEKNNLGKKRERDDENNKSLNDERFKNLPEENRKYLFRRIDLIEKESNMLSLSRNESDKIRKNTRNQILYILLYGIEELKLKKNDFWFSLPENKRAITYEEVKNEEDSIKFANKLSIEIETIIFSIDRNSNSINYKKKLIQLCQHLNDIRNTELRGKILLAQILPEKLVNMSSDELAPPDEKKKILEQQKKFFKEQVFVPEEMKIVAINYKDDNILSSVAKDTGINPFEVLDNNNNHHESDYSDNENNDKKKIGKNNQKSEYKALESKYSNLSSDMLNFYFALDKCKPDILKKEINEKLKQLKPETLEELNKLREKYNAIGSFK